MKELLERIKDTADKTKVDTPLSKAHTLGLRMDVLKSNLQATDYKAIKYAEGELSAEEYAETLSQRRAWRAEINALEEEIKAIKEGANEN